MVRYLFIAIFLFCYLVVSYGQNKVDSLIRVAPEIQQIETRIDVYNEICDLLWHDSPDMAIQYADTVYKLTNELNYPKGRVLALANKGIALYTAGNYLRAEVLYKEAIELAKANNISSKVEIYYFNLLKRQGLYRKLLEQIPFSIDSIAPRTLNPFYLIIFFDAFVEMGDIKTSGKLIKPIFTHETYKTDNIFRADANLVISEYYEMVGKLDSAKLLINQAIDIYSVENDNLSKAKAIMLLGTLSLKRGEVKAARQWLDSGLVLYEKTNYQYGVAEAKRNLAEFYSVLGEQDRASQLYFDALSIFEKQQNLNEITKVYNSLAWIYQSQGSYKTAYEFINKTIKLAEKIGNRTMLSAAYNTYGTFLDITDSLERAVEAYKKAYEISLEAGDKKRIAAALYNIAFVNEKLNRYDGVLDMYLASYKLEKEIDNFLGMAISEYTLGAFYTKKGNYNEAEKYLKKAEERLKSLDAKDNLLRSYRHSAVLYDKTGNYKKANDYYKLYIELKESLTNKTISSQLAELEVKYDLKNKDREIELLNLESKTREQELSLKEKTINNQRLLLGFIFIGSLLLIILLFVSYRLLKVRSRANEELKNLNKEIQEKNEEIMSQAEELQEANQQVLSMNQILEDRVGKRTKELKQAYNELDTFFYRSSHDFRRPLTTFLGLAEVAKSTLEDTYSLDLFEKVETTALQLDKMVYKLKAMSLISSDVLEQCEIDFNQITDSILSNHVTPDINDTVTIKKTIDLKQRFISYKELLEIIMENIVENSLQYRSNNNPYLSIEVLSKGDGILIKIEDNGLGIDEEFQKKVFDMYYRANEYSAGNGLGLYLVQKAVNKLGGKIELKSKVGKGTTIRIELPYSS